MNARRKINRLTDKIYTKHSSVISFMLSTEFLFSSAFFCFIFLPPQNTRCAIFHFHFHFGRFSQTPSAMYISTAVVHESYESRIYIRTYWHQREFIFIYLLLSNRHHSVSHRIAGISVTDTLTPDMYARCIEFPHHAASPPPPFLRAIDLICKKALMYTIWFVEVERGDINLPTPLGGVVQVKLKERFSISRNYLSPLKSRAFVNGKSPENGWYVRAHLCHTASLYNGLKDSSSNQRTRIIKRDKNMLEE